MSGLIRGGGMTSLVTGDATVNSGDVIITDPAKGVVVVDQNGDSCRIKVVDDDGMKSVQVEEVP